MAQQKKERPYIVSDLDALQHYMNCSTRVLDVLVEVLELGSCAAKNYADAVFAVADYQHRLNDEFRELVDALFAERKMKEETIHD